MIGRLAGDLLTGTVRLAMRLWPVWLFAIAWTGAHRLWELHLLSYGAWPAVTLAGPALLGLVAVGFYRAGLATRTAAIAGLGGMAPALVLTVRPEWARLAPDAGQAHPLPLHGAMDLGVLWAVALGVIAIGISVHWLRDATDVHQYPTNQQPCFTLVFVMPDESNQN